MNKWGHNNTLKLTCEHRRQAYNNVMPGRGAKPARRGVLATSEITVATKQPVGVLGTAGEYNLEQGRVQGCHGWWEGSTAQNKLVE